MNCFDLRESSLSLLQYFTLLNFLSKTYEEMQNKTRKTMQNRSEGSNIEMEANAPYVLTCT